jgi:primosomal protein N''
MFVKVLLPTPLHEAFTYSVPDGISNAVFGHRVIVPFGSRKLTGFIIGSEEEGSTDFTVRPISRVVDERPVFTRELLYLAESMESLYLCSPGQALSMMIPSGKRESESSLFEAEAISSKRIDKLSPDQEKAIRILDEAQEGLYYLYGVTGSGKSEVYLREAERVIKEGKQVIYLVPEITLTHQISAEVMERFDNKVAILHSALTPSQRLKYWNGILSGEVKLIIGARSAVFAPCLNLGLIILDEEHETSYKSGNTPRYHARQIAQLRASYNSIPLIMGSATPSLEAWYMMKRDAVKKIDMLHRVGAGAFPSVKIVSMLHEGRNISRCLEKEIALSLSRGRTVILFLNRRGYNYAYSCRNCGHVISCPNCSVPLTYHKNKGRLVCHYCGYSIAPLSVCPECGSTNLAVSGFGTEKIEEEVRRLFPSASVARLDTDVASEDRNRVATILEDFRAGRINILLGTQMVAKGLNFPLVDLVGVVLADSTLNVPDFRAEERTFSLLEQVAGRAGRYAPDGKVIIQTYQENNPAIVKAQEHDLFAFYEAELRVRKELAFPPFSRLVNLTFRSKKEAAASGSAEQFASAAEELIKEHSMANAVSIIGVSPCVIEKKAGSYRYHVLLSAKNGKLLMKLVSYVSEVVKLPSSVYMEIDADPVSLL